MKYYIDSELNLIPHKDKPWGKIIIVLLALGLLGMLFKYFTITPTFKIIYRPALVDQKKEMQLSVEDLTECLHENGCVLPNVAVAQAKLESNLGKSEVGKNAKNLFGITYHKCKYVTGKYGVYAKYDTYEDNIKCYIHIQDHYLTNIDGRYASDSEYTDKLKQIK